MQEAFKTLCDHPRALEKTAPRVHLVELGVALLFFQESGMRLLAIEDINVMTT